MNVVENMPLLPLRGVVVFPYMVMHFDVARKSSVNAVEYAMDNNLPMILVPQKDAMIDEPKFEDLNKIGTIAYVDQLIRLPNGRVRVLVQGEKRGIIKSLQTGEFMNCEVEIPAVTKTRNTKVVLALMNMVKDVFEKYVAASSRLTNDAVLAVTTIDDAGSLCDIVTSNSFFAVNKKCAILGEFDVKKRLKKLIDILDNEVELLEITNSIVRETQRELDHDQKEYVLREQLKVIRKELGEDDNQADEYTRRINESKIPDEHKEKLITEVKKLYNMSSYSPETGVIKNYLDTVLGLPWGVKTQEEIDLSKAKMVLNRDHYGLDEVKERIIEYLAVKKLSPKSKNSVLCLVGPPGVGKTSIVRSVAEAVNRKYYRMSLGGVRDEAEIRGHRKTYIGAMPGRIISAISHAKSQNPVILLDEVDKISSDFKGDPYSALLEVLDKEQNFSFTDHFLDIPYDISDVLFITTANSLETIPRPLLDRMEVIHLSSYTAVEKQHIASKFLVPKQRKFHGLSAVQLRIQKSALDDIINFYTRESGVRELERKLEKICRKVATIIAEDSNAKVVITSGNLEKYLGRRKFTMSQTEITPLVGVVNGLAWTEVGGDILPIEVAKTKGTGKLILTGKLGEVMQESAKAAYTYVKSNAESLEMQNVNFEEIDIHIHVPDGATPKDGPSAGIAITTAIISAITGYPVQPTVAMTGEVTIRGRVLPIGGLKEKVIAAFSGGVKTVIIPSKNQKDLDDIPAEIRENLKFVTVSDVEEVFPIALVNSREIPSSDGITVAMSSKKVFSEK